MTGGILRRVSRHALLPGLTMALVTAAIWLSVSVWWMRQPRDAFGVTGAALRIQERSIDGGEVRIGQPVRCTFHLYNASATQRRIVNVRPGCSCTTVAAVSREIAAGSWGEVTVEIETTRKTGPRSSSVLIETDDPKRPKINTLVTCTVLPAIALIPERLLFQSRAASGEFPPQSVRLTALYAGESLQLRSVQPSDSRIGINPHKSGSGQTMSFDVSVDPTIPDGTTLAFAVIHIDGSVQKSLRMPITIKNCRTLKSEPEVLRLPANSSQPQATEFTIRSITDAPLDVGRVTLPESEILSDLERLDNHRVRVRLRDLQVTNAWNSRHLEVTTSHGPLRVPITVSNPTSGQSMMPEP